MLLYAVSVEALHNNCYVDVASHLFGWQYGVVRSGATHLFHVVEWHQSDRVLRQFGMQQPIPESPSQPWNVHGLTLKDKQDENWFQLLAPFIS